MARWLGAVLPLWAAAVTSAAAQAPAPAPPTAAVQTFVACPVYRDTDAGRKSGCWLADDAHGVRFDVSLGPVKPQVGQMLLVEGVLSPEPAGACGGQVLDPVRVAVLQEPCPRQIIAADSYPGRPAKSPAEQMAPSDQPRVLPAPPYAERTFRIFFELDRDFLIYQYAEIILEKIALYAKASQAKHVRVEGYAATEPLRVAARVLREPLALAQARAQMVAESLRRLGVPAGNLEVTWRGAPAPDPNLEGGKLPEPSKRRVTVTVTP
jgi:outer membrane protein OmpA-like peptidoglycan-associated protein